MNNLPGGSPNVPRALVLQLARLGDLIQTLPVLSALRHDCPSRLLDLVCPAPLAPLAALFPDVETVLPWRAEAWQALAREWNGDIQAAISRAAGLLASCPRSSYPVAYNLNNHPRAILAAHLLSARVQGVGADGPFSPDPNPWAQYLRFVAAERGRNPVHLVDAFCGVCGVFPPTHVPSLRCETASLPGDLEAFCRLDGFRVAVVIGAGDPDRRLPVRMWTEWIVKFLDAAPEARVLVVGGSGERALVASLFDRLPAGCHGRVWDACGRVGFPELVALLSRCQWVIGSDTGPVHLGAACGARVMAFYVARARVHETGPYGKGHWAWQAVPSSSSDRHEPAASAPGVRPERWPIEDSLAVLLEGRCAGVPAGWTLWRSHRDEMGAWYEDHETGRTFRHLRSELWAQLNRESDVDWRSIHEMVREPCASGLR